MKKVITVFILSFLITMVSFATPFRGGKLTVISHTSSTVRIQIDGKRYPLEYNMLILNDIEPGNHTIRIVERASSGYNIPVNREKVLYNGSVYFRNNYHVDIVINRFGKTLIDEQEVAIKSLEEEEDGYGNETAMTDVSFESLKKTLQQERFTSSRMTVAKQAIANNYFKTEQVRQVAQLFSFEDDKMQVVKQAYSKTVDRSNYYLLSDLFSFTSNKEELTRFINENGGDYSSKPVISDLDFSKVKSRVQNTFSDNARVITAKQSIDANYFTAEQVKELLMLFSSESAKLEIAKYAYGKTVNRNGYSLIINDVFSSRLNKDELSRYIANYR